MPPKSLDCKSLRHDFVNFQTTSFNYFLSYNYHRDDEEIYKEFLEIANEHIPYIMKQESSGHSAHSILRSAQSFGDLLR